jgi:hypothetical protein
VSDPYDDALGAALRSRVGSLDASELTTAAAHDAVLTRARGIRRRRAAITGAAAMAAVVLGGFILLRGGDEQTLVPATDPPTTLEQLSPTTPSTQAPSTEVATTLPPSTVVTTAPGTTVVTTSSAPTTPVQPSPTTETYRSAGGSVTVSWDGSSLRLVSVDPAAGHEAEVEDDTAARIRVRFRGPDDSRIEVEVENGVPTVDID